MFTTRKWVALVITALVLVALLGLSVWTAAAQTDDETATPMPCEGMGMMNGHQHGMMDGGRHGMGMMRGHQHGRMNDETMPHHEQCPYWQATATPE